MKHANETEYYLHSAEQAFTSNKFQEAIKIAKLALSRNPTEKISLRNLIPAYEVHLAASRKTPSGETDWYRVLGIPPDSSTTANSSEIKKSYRKLALLVHPDKNKSLAAEGAFKLISQAFEILSDSERRRSFDDSRNCYRPSSHPTDQSSPPSAPEPAEEQSWTPTKGSTTRCSLCEHWRTNKPPPFRYWPENICRNCHVLLRRWTSSRKEKKRGWTNFYHA